MAVQTTIKLRRDTAANWASVNPVLSAGEQGLETDTNRLKVGNGTASWNSIGYSNLTQTDFLQTFFGYSASGYETMPRALATNTSFHANNQISWTLFTPLKTFTASTVSTMASTSRSSYGYISSYKGIGVYQAVPAISANVTLTPLAVTWDKDDSLWTISNHGPGLTTTTLATSVASNSNNFTLVTCTGTGATFTNGQTVTVSGGTGGFTSFTGRVVGSPTATTWILQATGSGVVTGTMTGGSAVGLTFATGTPPAVTSGSVVGGTGFVASVSITTASSATVFAAGQWLSVNGASNSFSGYVAESPTPTTTGFTLICPSTLTSGSVGSGTIINGDSFGRNVRPLFSPTPSGSGVVTPTTVTFNAGTTYAVGFLISASGGTVQFPALAANTAVHNTLFLPVLTSGLTGQTTITSASVQGGGITANAAWARLT
jgi:hypothetical protein